MKSLRSAVSALAAFAVAFGSAAALQVSVEVVASRRGFRPGTVELRRGESVRLALSTADVEHCFALDAFRVEKRIVPGRTTFVEITPDRTGSFPFHCCLEPGNESLHGRLVVTE